MGNRRGSAGSVAGRCTGSCYRPQWILSHVLIVALMVTMINLMFWQVHRLHEQKDTEPPDRAQHEAAAPRPGRGHGAVSKVGADTMQYRRVVAAGTYDTGSEVDPWPTP